jgi:hypothetical protein
MHDSLGHCVYGMTDDQLGHLRPCTGSVAHVHEQADGWFVRCESCEWDGRLHYAGRPTSREVAEAEAAGHNRRRHPTVADLMQGGYILWHRVASEDIAEVIEEALRAGDTELVTRARRALNRRARQQS